MNEKAKQLLDKLETLGELSDLWHKDFWITRSPFGGYTVVSSERNRAEHFSNAQRVVDFLSKYDKSLGKTLYEVSLNHE
nr:MAG TPA: hypothetical protein [Caudoviricetes sp.]